MERSRTTMSMSQVCICWVQLEFLHLAFATSSCGESDERRLERPRPRLNRNLLQRPGGRRRRCTIGQGPPVRLAMRMRRSTVRSTFGWSTRWSVSLSGASLHQRRDEDEAADGEERRREQRDDDRPHDATAMLLVVHGDVDASRLGGRRQ